MTVTLQGHFLADTKKIIYVLAQPQNGYIGHQCFILEIMGPAIVSEKMHFLKNCPVVVLDEVEVKA